jgi:7-carboxy-7-deazaguanine synthase
MFGKNPVVSKSRSAEDGYVVTEIFPTIQGEGPLAGQPALFVRFAHCNLRCYFCDTYFETGTVYEPADLFDEIGNALGHAPRTRLVVFTGGEPMLQPIFHLAGRLILAFDVTVQIETAGTVWPREQIPQLPLGRLQIVCSPKTMGLHSRIPNVVTAWKYILSADDPGDPNDGLPLLSTQRPDHLSRVYRPSASNRAPIYVQPCDEQDEEKNRANITHAANIAMKYGYRLSLQLHKIVGLP